MSFWTLCQYILNSTCPCIFLSQFSTLSFTSKDICIKIELLNTFSICANVAHPYIFGTYNHLYHCLQLYVKFTLLEASTCKCPPTSVRGDELEPLRGAFLYPFVLVPIGELTPLFPPSKGKKRSMYLVLGGSHTQKLEVWINSLTAHST